MGFAAPVVMPTVETGEINVTNATLETVSVRDLSDTRRNLKTTLVSSVVHHFTRFE